MFFKIFLLFATIPLLELAILIKIGQFLGILWTVGIVVITAILGAYISKLQGLLVLKNIQKEISKGIMPTEELLNGAIIIISGFLFLTPGVLTDLVAFAGIVPFTRSFIKDWLKSKINSMVIGGKTITVNYDSYYKDDD